MYRITYETWNSWIQQWVVSAFHIPAAAYQLQRQFYLRQQSAGVIRNLSMYLDHMP